MTRIFVKNKLAVISLFLSCSICMLTTGSAANREGAKKMNNASQLIFEKIGRLDRGQFPSKEDVESVFDGKFVELPRRNTMQYYEISTGIKAKDVIFDKADLRIDEKNSIAILILSISKICAEKSGVFDRYSHLKITNVPRGHSLDEETSYTAERAWGSITFGFKEENRNCLSSVTFSSEK